MPKKKISSESKKSIVSIISNERKEYEVNSESKSRKNYQPKHVK